MAFWAYMLRCADGSFYVGHTDDLETRVGAHRSGNIPGYSAERLPVELVWSQAFTERDEAFRAERRIKGWSRAKKEALIRDDWDGLQFLSRKLFVRSFDTPLSAATQDERQDVSPSPLILSSGLSEVEGRVSKDEGRYQNPAHPEEGLSERSETKACLEGPVIVLVRPQLGQNIGKAARAMLNFGLTELRLVAPRDGWPNPDAGPAASGADIVLEKAKLLPRNFDVAVEASGAESGFQMALDLLKPRGKLVLKSTFHGAATWQAWRVVVDEITIVGSRCGRFAPALELLRNKKINVEDLISEELSLTDGVKAIKRAGQKGVIKVLLSMR